MLAAVGGLLAAIVSGVVWGLITIWTNSEVGYVAIGVGWLCGAAVVFFGRNARGPIFQLIASAFSILGIAIGKYYFFFLLVKEITEEDIGAEMASRLSMFDPVVFTFFLQNLGDFFSFYDVLFIALAVYMAWRIPQQTT
jgi:hypothetical protein